MNNDLLPAETAETEAPGVRLSAKALKFLGFYLSPGVTFMNASASARAAGYTENRASALLKQSNVIAHIQDYVRQLGSSRERVIVRLIDLSMNPRKVFEEDGVKPTVSEIIRATDLLAKILGLYRAPQEIKRLPTGVNVAVAINCDRTRPLREVLFDEQGRSQVPGIPNPTPDVVVVVDEGQPPHQ